MLKLFSNKSFEEYKRLVKENIEYYKTLTPEQLEAISYYKGNGYSSITEILLKSQVFNMNIPYYDYIVKNIKLLTEIIYNAPKTKTEIITYRGMANFIDANYIQDDNIYYSRSFTSVSIVKDVAFKFAGSVCCLFKVIIPKDTLVLPVISPDVDYEGELILLPFSDFQIENKLEKVKVKDKILIVTPGKKIQQLQKMSYDDMIKATNLFKDSYLTEYTLRLIETPTIEQLTKYINRAVDITGLSVLIYYDEFQKMLNKEVKKQAKQQQNKQQNKQAKQQNIQRKSIIRRRI